jgi:hypothetical protein
MGQLINVLAIDNPDWTIPWAGIGALLLGLGSTLSGWAAIIAARRTTQAREQKDEEQQQDNNIGDSRVGDGSGKRVSGSDSIESEPSGSDPDSDD